MIIWLPQLEITLYLRNLIEMGLSFPQPADVRVTTTISSEIVAKYIYSNDVAI